MKSEGRGLPAAGKGAGASLMAAVAVMIVATLVSPGVSLIDPVDQTDTASALASLGENPNLGHLTTLLAMVSMLLYARAFWAYTGLSAMNLVLPQRYCEPES